MLFTVAGDTPHSAATAPVVLPACSAWTTASLISGVMVARFRRSALAAGAEEAAGYTVLTQAIKGASRLAIWLSERL